MNAETVKDSGIAGETGKYEGLRKRYISELIAGSLGKSGSISMFQGFDYLMKGKGSREFSPEEIKGLWERYLKEDPGHMLSFYLHIPFCVTKCNYCCYDSYAPVKKSDLDGYMSYMLRQFMFFKDTFRRHVFDTLYVGGGTPNILSLEQIETLYSGLFRSFSFREGAEKKIELNPEFNTKPKLELLKRFGFNKVSFGIQSFDEGVLKTANRGYQREDLVSEAVRHAARLGFDEVNVDLMFGLEGDTPDSFIAGFKKAMSLGPDSINVYKLQPTDEYKRLFVGSAAYDELFRRVYPDPEGLIRQMAEAAEAKGYFRRGKGLDYSNMAWGFKLGKGHGKDGCRKRSGSGNKRSYTFFHEEPMSCFGLGRFAQSHIFCKAVYMDNGAGFEKPGPFFGSRISRHREAINHIILSLEADGSFSSEELKKRFGEVPSLEDEISRLIGSGRLKKDGDRLRFVHKPGHELLRSFAYLLDKDQAEAFLRMFGGAGRWIRIKAGSAECRVRIEAAEEGKRYAAVSNGLGLAMKGAYVGDILRVFYKVAGISDRLVLEAVFLQVLRKIYGVKSSKAI